MDACRYANRATGVHVRCHGCARAVCGLVDAFFVYTDACLGVYAHAHVCVDIVCPNGSVCGTCGTGGVALPRAVLWKHPAIEAPLWVGFHRRAEAVAAPRGVSDPAEAAHFRRTDHNATAPVSALFPLCSTPHPTSHLPTRTSSSTSTKPLHFPSVPPLHATPHQLPPPLQRPRQCRRHDHKRSQVVVRCFGCAHSRG
jgi:hypothetical protein